MAKKSRFFVKNVQKKYRGGEKKLVFPLFFTDSGQDSQCRKVKTLYREEGETMKRTPMLWRGFYGTGCRGRLHSAAALDKKLGEAHNVFVSDTGTNAERTNDVLLQESSEEGK